VKLGDFTDSASLGGTSGSTENPTLTDTPLKGEEFAERMRSPI